MVCAEPECPGIIWERWKTAIIMANEDPASFSKRLKEVRPASEADQLGGRLPLVDIGTLGEEQRRLFDHFERMLFPWARSANVIAQLPDGRPIGPFNVFLYSPEIAQGLNDWADAEMIESTLSSQIREVVILTVAASWGVSYSIYAHRNAAGKAGNGDETVAAIIAGQEPVAASNATRAAWRFTKELALAHGVTDAVYSAALEMFGVRGVVDMANLIGVHMAMAAQLNAFQVPAPDGTLGHVPGRVCSSSQEARMSFVKTQDGTELFYKDWGEGQPVVFHHGWPLSSDDWDAQMLFFLSHGYRVVAHDRRGHGRSTQTALGHDMDTYAADAAAVVEHLDLKDAIHIGHSTGGGEVARYVAKYGKGRVAKAVLVSAVPPIMVKSKNNPDGTPIEVFDVLRAQLAANRAGFYRDLPMPFYGFNRDGATVDEGVVGNWWRQGMIGSALAQYEGIKAFSETDQTEDLRAIDVPVLILQGDDDQIVPYKDSALRQKALIRDSTMKIYPGFPHGMLTTHADIINPDLLAFIRR